MGTELPVTNESLEPPDFTFSADKPVDAMGALTEQNFEWAVIERLDYIARALYLLVEGNDGTPIT